VSNNEKDEIIVKPQILEEKIPEKVEINEEEIMKKVRGLTNFETTKVNPI
jgi:hypothetical protein